MNEQEYSIVPYTGLNEMQPGEQWNNIQVPLGRREWQPATTDDVTLKTYSFSGWSDHTTTPGMNLSTGKHTVRVAFVIENPGLFRVISNPVELEIQNSSSQTK